MCAQLAEADVVWPGKSKCVFGDLVTIMHLSRRTIVIVQHPTEPFAAANGA
jgi:hypothetical protein